MGLREKLGIAVLVRVGLTDQERGIAAAMSEWWKHHSREGSGSDERRLGDWEQGWK